MHDLVIRGGTIFDGTGRERFSGDIAIDGGVLTQVGGAAGSARREIDADGALVTPGFVDVHTHYDAQVTWDSLVSSSCWHGVTTVVMGNCGVGFAPVRPDRRRWFIGLMEAVEDIPAAVLEEALSWDWQTFPEYLDAIDRMPRAIDVAAMLTHSPLRVFVMGERGADHEAAPTADELVQMQTLAREAARAGAIGASTARTRNHRTGEGKPVPCYGARSDELEAIARGLVQGGAGFLELAAAFEEGDIESEFAGYRGIAARTGCEISIPLLQNPADPNTWRSTLARIEDAARDGVPMTAQIAIRPVGALFGLLGSMNPFAASATARSLTGLSIHALQQRLANAEVFEAILRESEASGFIDPGLLYPMETPVDYFPGPEKSVAARAAAKGVSPRRFILDYLRADPQTALLYMPVRNWISGDDSVVADQLASPVARPGLGDGGAHCTQICDVSAPTTLLSYWGRDRRQGPTMAIEGLVKRQTLDTARLAGLHDRGILRPGFKADLNVIDWDDLGVARPEFLSDFPAGGRRLVQRATGYRAMIVSGQPVFFSGEHSGALPGRVVRRRSARATQT